MTQAYSAAKRRRVLVVMCASLFLVNIDNTVVNVALPTLGEQLDTAATGRYFREIFLGFHTGSAGRMSGGGR